MKCKLFFLAFFTINALFAQQADSLAVEKEKK